MSKSLRNGDRRKLRHQLMNRRKPELGYYLIVTDAKETEKNYIAGFKNSVSNQIADKLVVKTICTETRQLVKEALNFRNRLPQYAECWIIFDKDQVLNFDNIIREARDSGINVAWSNPCIEVWFNAYFGKMPVYQDSVECCRRFSSEYMNKTKKEYKKSCKTIYADLINHGDEDKAIRIAKQRKEQRIREGKNLPSEMNSVSTVYELIEEIKDKI